MADTLFEALPSTLFNPLAARGAPIYAQVLLSLFAATQQSYQPLSRESLMFIVSEALAVPEALELTNDADNASLNEGDEDDVIQERASAIIRYLARCGWLQSEMQSDFGQTYILPDYAFRLLAVFSDIARSEPPALGGLIYSIYAVLHTAQADMLHIALPEAGRQTGQLLNGLKELQHNIGIHIERVLRQADASGILEQFFLNYRNEIIDRAYHQLRTTDHVSRFRPGVLEALTQVQRTDNLDVAAQRLFQTRAAPTLEAAAQSLLTHIHAIREQFESLDDFLQSIDIRHSQFVDAAVRNIELRLSASTSTSGQIHTLLERVLHAQSETDTDDFALLLDLFRLELIDSDSLSAPGRTAESFVPVPTLTPQLTEQEIDTARTATLQHLRHSINRERVRRFAFELLGDLDTICGSDIPIDRPEDLPLLMYLRAYGNGSLGYRVDDLPDAAWIIHGDIGFRDFVLRRIEHPHTDV